MIAIYWIRLIIACLGVVFTVTSMAAPPLPSFNIDENSISVSGVSSGGYLAQQFHVAYSASVMGAAIIAAGPYRCAGTGYPWNLWRVFNRCMNAQDMTPFLGPPNVQDSIQVTRDEADLGHIDDPGNLQNDKVYLFSGTRDETVPSAVMGTLNRYYGEFVDDVNMAYVNDIAAGHGMITDDGGNARCDVTETPFINDCDYDTAGALLTHIYGNELVPPGDWDNNALLAFDQGEFSDDIRTASLNDTGYVYVPESCRNGQQCRLHVAFHGCRQHFAAIGNIFYTQAGYNEWAETNNIIVLYPQAAARGSVFFPWPNPRGCWDWWGYTGPDFYHKSGAQLAAVKAMIDRLIGR